MIPTLNFTQLEQAAFHILHLIRNTNGLQNTRLAIIGDLAVRKYLPQQVLVASIDFVISKSSSPGRVKKEIVGHPMSPLAEKSGSIFYQHSSGWELEVRLIPDWLCPYLPTSARPVRDDIEILPYVSLEDLLVFKVDACGLHERVTSKQREARDAAALLALASEHTSLKMEEDKLDKIQQSLADVAEFSLPEHDKSWWQRRLGVMAEDQKSAQEILSELSDHAFSSPTSPGQSQSSNNSSISRSSSYISSILTHSTSTSIYSLPLTDEKQMEQKGRPRKLSLTSKMQRHKRHPPTGAAATKTTLTVAMQRLELERPASPGMALTNRI
ncbi:Fc.00g116330.m01.CDS01 [Cosmosporella sp. VM-42]